jgi:hypothetical protein
MPKTTAQSITAEIQRFMESPANTMKNADDEPAWASPLVGFSSAADPLYAFYRKDIGDFFQPLRVPVHADRRFRSMVITESEGW